MATLPTAIQFLINETTPPVIKMDGVVDNKKSGSMPIATPRAAKGKNEKKR